MQDIYWTVSDIFLNADLISLAFYSFHTWLCA